MSGETREQEEVDEPGARSTRSMVARRGIALRGRSIRQHAARGTIINTVFSVTLALVSLLRGLAIARFLTRADYGVWGILIASMGTLFLLKQVGVGDKYIQQEGGDEELGFQRAFSVELVFSAVFMLLLILAVPVVAAAYGRSELILPGLALAMIVPANVLQSPAWIFYRQMRFARQRALQAVDLVVGTATALALAIAGAGYWALLGGVLAGAWSSALVTVLLSPYRLRFRLERSQLRSYMAFSWPLFVASVSGMVVIQASLYCGTDALGLAGAGAITLAANISIFGTQADAIVSGTMYPVVCAVQSRLDLLHESFVKSNRLALLWAMPFGLGLTLFAPDLVHYVLGDKWRPAIPLLQAFGIFQAIGHVAFNWDNYFRARNETRPMAWAAFVTMAAFMVSGIPMIYAWGLDGFAAGIGVQLVANIACRVFFLRRLFAGFDMLSHAARAAAPALTAAASVLIVRAFEPRRRHAIEAIVELATYLAVTAASTWGLERGLLREMASYLQRARSGPAAEHVSPEVAA